MWTLIPKEFLTDYENQYKLREQFPEQEYILHTTSTHIMLPRHFNVTYPSSNLLVHHDSNFNSVELTNFNFLKPLRENQEPIVDSFISFYNTHGYVRGILNAYPGCGKTAMAIYLACTLKKKTLIIVDNEKLKEQFKDSIKNFTNLTDDDIGLIQGSIFDADKPIVITMVQSLLSKIKNSLDDFYVKMRDCGFDLVIYDEVHKTSSSSKYAMSSLLLNTKNVIGLSATPYVTGSHAMLLFNTMGPILHSTKEYEFKPKIYYVRYDSSLDSKVKNRSRFIKDYIRLQAFYNSIIFDNPKYLNTIQKLATKCVESNHKTMILVSTVKQIDSVIGYLSNFGLTAKALYSKSPHIDKEKDNLLVGTFKYCSAGFDFEELSALILASPYKGKISLVQSIGRILRSSKGKKDPVVFDLLDEQFPTLFENAVNTKNIVYKEEFGGCSISYVKVD